MSEKDKLIAYQISCIEMYKELCKAQALLIEEYKKQNIELKEMNVELRGFCGRLEYEREVNRC